MFLASIKYTLTVLTFKQFQSYILSRKSKEGEGGGGKFLFLKFQTKQ